MPIKIRCSCGNVLLAPEERVGQTGHCPNCHAPITVTLESSKAIKQEKKQEAKKEKQEAKKDGNLPVKPSLPTRLLGSVVYLLFFLLFFSTLSLHIFSFESIYKLEIKKPMFLKNFWLEYKPLILSIRKDQYDFYRNFFSSKGKSQEKTKSQESK